jgi:hypothetical protein
MKKGVKLGKNTKINRKKYVIYEKIVKNQKKQKKNKKFKKSNFLHKNDK